MLILSRGWQQYDVSLHASTGLFRFNTGRDTGSEWDCTEGKISPIL